MDELPEQAESLAAYIKQREQRSGPLKEGAAAQLLWADPASPRPTPYSIVYLHGFKASQGEGEPVHRHIAQKFGCNLYLSRLKGHGKKGTDGFKGLTADDYIESARFAFQVGKRTGQKVILMGTSTGGSLALWLAAQEEYRSSIAGLLLYSPLISFYGVNHWLLGNRIGRGLLNIFPGKNYLMHSASATKQESQIWYDTYRLQGALALGEFVQQHMEAATFKQVTCPVWTGCYYKNRKQQDTVVSVSAIKKMVKELATPQEQKDFICFPDAGTHVILSGLLSKDVKHVENKSAFFLEKVLALKPLEHN